jgi:ABC-type glycerol-3-phosphate transport system substrate-binding protein
VATAPDRGSWLPRWMASEHPLPWLVPSSALMIVFGLYPLIYAIWLSLHKRNPVTRKNIFDPSYNWTKFLGDPRFWDAVVTTFTYAFIALIIQLLLGLLIALLLDSDRKGYALLRAVADAGFGEIPNVGHQGGSVLGLSKYSKNIDAAWLFMQWACSKDVMTRCTLAGGFAPMRLSSFADPRVKEKAKVGSGTTRHLETVKWTIDNVMASEPDMPLWAGFSTNEIPTELGKLLTNQDYGGDPKKCMDNVAAMIDKAVADAGL